MMGDLGDLAVMAGAAETTDIRRDAMPNKSALDIRDRSIRSLVRESMDTVEDSRYPGAGHKWSRGAGRHVAEHRNITVVR